MPAIPGMRRAATKAAKANKKAKKKRPGGDPRKAAAGAGSNSAAQPAGTGPGGPGGPGGDGHGGLPGGMSGAGFQRELAEGLASLQQGGGLPPGLPGLTTPDSNVPAAFRGQGGKRRKKK
jgi:hypothetical protein